MCATRRAMSSSRPSRVWGSRFRAVSGTRARRDASPGARSSTGSRSRMSWRSEEHTSELQSLMRISYAVFCLKKKKQLEESETGAERMEEHKIYNLRGTGGA